MPYRPIICFDTSAINRLADDFDSYVLQALIARNYFSRITSTSIEEIVKNQGRHRRQQLNEFINPLVAAGECVLPPHQIVKKLAQAHATGKDFDWRKSDIRFYVAEDAAHRDVTATDELVAQQYVEMKRLDSVFCGFFDTERFKFDDFYKRGTEPRPKTFQQFIDRIKLGNEGMFWGMAEVIYQSATATTPDRQKLTDFIDKCPPFRAFLLAVLIAHYERGGIRDLKDGLSVRAGRFDLFSAIYLCYCDQFISAERRRRQYNALREIASVGKLRARVRTYEELRWRIFPFSSFSTRYQSVLQPVGAASFPCPTLLTFYDHVQLHLNLKFWLMPYF